MIVYKDTKGYETRSDKPNANWTNEDVYVVEDGSELANKIIDNYPYYDFVIEGDRLVDVVSTERPKPEIKISEQEELENYVLDLDYRVAMMEIGL